MAHAALAKTESFMRVPTVSSVQNCIACSVGPSNSRSCPAAPLLSSKVASRTATPPTAVKRGSKTAQLSARPGAVPKTAGLIASHHGPPPTGATHLHPPPCSGDEGQCLPSGGLCAVWHHPLSSPSAGPPVHQLARTYHGAAPLSMGIDPCCYRGRIPAPTGHPASC